jgi:hypothetical protein
MLITNIAVALGILSAPTAFYPVLAPIEKVLDYKVGAYVFVKADLADAKIMKEILEKEPDDDVRSAMLKDRELMSMFRMYRFWYPEEVPHWLEYVLSFDGQSDLDSFVVNTKDPRP